MENLNKYISIYQNQLKKGAIIIAYNELLKFVVSLRTKFIKTFSNQYSFGGILHGYLDYTYFYYSNDFLKNKKLKFGLVLNHVEMRFEIWLLGNTIPIQKKYWELLKNTKWNQEKEKMPKYSILETVLAKNLDFNNLEKLTKQIKTEMIKVSDEILDHLKTLDELQ